MRVVLFSLSALALAACGDRDGARAQHPGDSTEVSINADGDDGKLHISAGKDGNKVKIDGGGVNIDIDVPDIADLDIDSDFDIDGVKLYPGSHVNNLDINASDKGGDDKATVNFGFTSPTSPQKAADWMAGEFAKKDIKVTRSGDRLAGKDKDGDDFTIAFAPDGANAKGQVVIVSR